MVFPLIMKNGKEIRNLKELRENADINRIVEYFINGTLQEWLGELYTVEGDSIRQKLDEIEEKDNELVTKLMDALKIGNLKKTPQVDIDEIELKNKLVEKIENPEKIIHETADSQERLEKLLRSGAKTIYLYANTFSISKSVHHIEFKGIDHPRVIILERNKELFLKQGNSFDQEIEAGNEKSRKLLKALQYKKIEETERISDSISVDTDNSLNAMLYGLLNVIEKQLETI